MTQGAHILAIDDEAGILFFIEEALRRAGHQVTGVGSGEDALTRLEQESFDLAIVDLRLKGMDGMQVLAALRARWPETAAIFLTAHGSIASALEALEMGAYDYVPKPCSMKELRATVGRALDPVEREARREALLAGLHKNGYEALETIRAESAEPQ